MFHRHTCRDNTPINKSNAFEVRRESPYINYFWYLSLFSVALTSIATVGSQVSWHPHFTHVGTLCIYSLLTLVWLLSSHEQGRLTWAHLPNTTSTMLLMYFIIYVYVSLSMYVSISMSMSVYMHVHEGTGRGWKMTLELKLQVSWPMWVLQEQFSVRAASDLSRWTLVPGLICDSLGYEYLTKSSNTCHSN